MAAILNITSTFLYLVRLLLIVYVAMTWIAPRSPLRYWLERIAQPFLAPFRGLARTCIVRWGCPFDLSVLFALIGLTIFERILNILLISLMRIF